MTAKGRIPGREIRYIPEAFGNRDDTDPVAITYRVPTEREKRELTVFGGVAGNEETILAKQHKTLRACVSLVENYNNQSGKPILTGADLAEFGDSLIVFEMVGEIMARAEPGEDEIKKSAGSPDSGSMATQP